MISPMTRYSFILLNGEQDGLLEQLQELGLVDITRSARPVDEQSRRLMSDVELLDGLIKGIRAADIPEGTAVQPLLGGDSLSDAAGDILMKYTETGDALLAAEKQLAALRPWGDYSRETLGKLAAAGVPVHFHRLSAKQFKPEWAGEYALSVIAEDRGNVCFAVAGDDALPGEIAMPAQTLAEAESEAAALRERKALLAGHVLALRERLPELEALRADALSGLDLYLAGASAAKAAGDRIVTLEGFAPVADEAAITARLDEIGVLYLKEAARAEENPPISFRNNAFVRLFEPLTDMYGRPAYNGFDPTPFISVFFMLFFAFCMGDCGYGLILMAIGLVMGRSAGMKSLAPLVTVLGGATVVIGFLFHTFFSMDIAQWSLFAPIRGIFLPSKIMGYDGTMVLALLVGVFHICLAMVVKTCNETRNKGFANSLGTWGWTLLVVGGVIVGGIAFAGVLSAAVTKWVVIVLGVVSAVGIFLLNDLHRNPLLNIGSGLWETYNTVTGLLGDVLSYLRLYALGLAGSMLGLAFNKIGLMILGDGSAYAMWIPFVLVVVVGHTLNIAMCALGAFVHPLRLNFLEFFKNSGYEAAGRRFNPLTKNSNNK